MTNRDHDDHHDDHHDGDPTEAGNPSGVDAELASHPEGRDLDALGSKLRSSLAGGMDPVEEEPIPADDLVPGIRDRAAQLRQRKVMGLAMAAVLALLVGGSALALGRTGGTEGTLDLADASRSTEATGSSLDGTAPDTASGSLVDEPMGTGTTLCEAVLDRSQGNPVRFGCSEPTSVPSTTSPCSASCSTETTMPKQTTVPPSSNVTTIPPSSSPTTSPPVVTLPMIDCGRSTPSGYPTTTASPPTLGRCLVDAFNVGQPATLTVVQYFGGPENRVESNYEVIGVRTVKMVFSTNSGAPTTPPARTTTCRALVDVWPDPAIVQASQCS